MTEKHLEKLTEYVTIKERATYQQLLRFSEDEKTDLLKSKYYTGALEEWHAYSTILDLLQDENLLDKMLAIWKE